MNTQQAAQSRYRIEIKPNGTGAFDVISDGTSYRIHRNLPESKADTVAAEIKALLKRQGLRCVILKAAECAK